MATLHGFPILVTGERWCVVDMPDYWAIMDSLDAVPTPVFQYQKDDSGWREAMAQLKRSDTRPPTVPTVMAPVAPPPVRHGRRQFSLARFGILLSSIVLGVSPWLPWATIQVSLNGGPSSSIRGDLFKIMSHGWRNSVAEILVGLAVVCAIQALVLPFTRIALVSAILGFLSLAPVILGATQIHTYVGPGFSHPPVSIGYGMFVAFGGCLLLIMAWAVFPGGVRRPSKRAGAPNPAVAGPSRTGHIMEGLTPVAPPPPPTRTVAESAMPVMAPVSAPAAGAAGSVADGVSSSGLPTLGAALAQLSEHDHQPVVAASPPVRLEPDGPAASSSSSASSGLATSTQHQPGPQPADVESAEPVAITPEVAEPVAEPEAIEPEAIEPEAIEPEAIEPEAIEPEAIEPEAIEPEAIEPEAIEPEAAAADPAPEPADDFPPGWYADYADSSLLRYWDGDQWTEHTTRPRLITESSWPGIRLLSPQGGGLECSLGIVQRHHHRRLQGAMAVAGQPNHRAQAANPTAWRAKSIGPSVTFTSTTPVPAMARADDCMRSIADSRAAYIASVKLVSSTF